MNLHLDFAHQQFTRIVDFVSDKSVQISISKMVDLEVKKKLKDKVTELHKAPTKNLHLQKYFLVKPIKLEAAVESALLDFENFKMRLDVEILELQGLRSK